MSRNSDRTPSPDSSTKPQKALFLVDTSDEDDAQRTGQKRKRSTQKATQQPSARVKTEGVVAQDADVVMLSSPDAKLVKAASRPQKPRAAPAFERGLLGSCVCSAWSLTKGKGYCSPGSIVVIERAKTKEEREAERLAKGAAKGKGKSSAPTVIKNGKVVKQTTLSLGSKPKPVATSTKLATSSANNPNDTIIRFSNTRGFEIGRLPTALARHLAPLLAANLIHLSGTIIDCPTPLTVGCDITLEVSVYLTRDAFRTQESREDAESEKATWGKEGETVFQRELRMRKDSLIKLFERVGLKPIRWSALTKSQSAAAKAVGTENALKVKPPPSKSGSPEVIEFEDSSDDEKPSATKFRGKEKASNGDKFNGNAKLRVDKGKGKQVDVNPRMKREAASNGDALDDDDVDSGAEEEVLDEKQLHDLENIFNRANQADGLLAEVEPPETFLYTLRPYQKQALGWMTALENGDANLREKSMHPLWEEYKFKKESGSGSILDDGASDAMSFFFNPYDGDLSLDFPKANSRVRGGILADSMGMGKTCMMASLLHTNRQADEPLSEETARDSASETDDASRPPKFRQLTLNRQWQPTTAATTKALPARRHATLVVCPVSLAKQWAQELDRMSAKGTLRSVLWYGNERPDLGALLDTMDEDARTDVIVTTYGTLQSEHAKWLNRQGVRSQLKSLFDIPWLRVVLDEAHTIKNRMARASKACYELDSQRRWALTGTPIVNRLDDLYSLLHFLRLEPWGQYGFFRSFVTVPFMAQDPKAIDVVQFILEQCLLRREKNMKDKDGKPIVDLPLKTVTVETLEFSRAERKIYDAIYDRSRRKFIQLDQEGTMKNSYISILAMLMRLRQAVDHPLLVMNKASSGENGKKDDILDMMTQDDKMNIRDMIARYARGKDVDDAESDSPTEKTELETLASSQSVPECVICGYEVDGEVILPCYHTACRDCIVAFIEKAEDNGKVPACPACGKAPILTNQLREKGQSRNAFYKSQPALKKVDFQTSTKLKALIKRLKAIEEQDPHYKALVFSQFTSMLSLIEPVLTDNGISWLRFDGAMDQRARAAVVDEFAKPRKTPQIMLISLKAGGVGLNLTMANHVFLMDCWWNSSTEDQAVDRVHRLGQNKPVFVTRFVIRDTIEKRILKIQKHKTALVDASLAGTEQSKSGGSIADLKAIFGLNEVDPDEEEEVVGEKVWTA